MLRMSCCFCRVGGRSEGLPRGWKALGNAVLCPQCRQKRYRLRSVTMTVVEPSGPRWHELRAALEESSIQAPHHDRVWEARIADGQPLVRVLIKDRWWELRLKGSWCGGQRAAFEKIASGAAPGELFFYPVPTDDTQIGNSSGGHPNPHSKIKCRLVAWLPRMRSGDAETPPDALPAPASQFHPPHLGEMDLRDLRKALRANQVSFPSQVPTFTRYDPPDLERKITQLYYLLGWNCGKIGARYGLGSERVREILNTWKRRAVKAGCIQHIPPAEAISQQPMLRTQGSGFQSLPTNVPIESPPPPRHTNLDTYERIIPDNPKKASAELAAAVWYVANRGDMIPRFSKENMPAPVEPR